MKNARKYENLKREMVKQTMTTQWVWLFAVLLLATQAQAKVIQGTVTDASTGEPLPAATVHVLGAYDGTISNTEGRYVLSLRSLPAVVEVRYIGYRWILLCLRLQV